MRIIETFQMIRYLKEVIARGNRKMIFRCFIGIFSIAILFVSVSTAFSANWYVRKGATGSNNGSNWTNAWNEMNQINWSSVSPGDTIWLAGGTYTTPISVAKSGTLTNRINVQRVRSTDTVPVAAAGWNGAFDTQVIINNDRAIRFESSTNGVGSYVTIDGRIDSGIRAYTSCSTNWADSALSVETNNITDIVVQYIDMAGPGGRAAYPHGTDCNGVRLYNNGGKIINPTIRYNRIHGVITGTRILGQQGGLWEYNKFYHNDTTTDYHANLVAVRQCYNTITFRYNDMYEYMGEGIMLGAMAADTPCAVEIYGNVFHTDSGQPGGSPRALELQYMPWTVKFYNNTIADLAISVTLAQTGAAWGAGSEMRNNIFCSTSKPSYPATTTHNVFSNSSIAVGTNTQIVTSSIFTDYLGKDFTLALPTNVGYGLPSPYNADKLSKTRGRDASWDIGAYEYESNGSLYESNGSLLPPNRFRRVANP